MDLFSSESPLAFSSDLLKPFFLGSVGFLGARFFGADVPNSSFGAVTGGV